MRYRASGSSYILGKWRRSTPDDWKLQFVNLKAVSEVGNPHESCAPVPITFPEVDGAMLRPQDWNHQPKYRFDELSGRLAFLTSFQNQVGSFVELINFA